MGAKRRNLFCGKLLSVQSFIFLLLLRLFKYKKYIPFALWIKETEQIFLSQINNKYKIVILYYILKKKLSVGMICLNLFNFSSRIYTNLNISFLLICLNLFNFSSRIYINLILITVHNYLFLLARIFLPKFLEFLYYIKLIIFK